MAAIIEPRTHLHGATSYRPSRPPRHLSAVAVPVEPLFSPAALAAMAAALLVAVLLALGIGAGAFSGLVPTPGSEPIAAADARVVVVEPGDSVWSIARSIQPEGDLRPLVHRIVQANGAAPLQPGQQLVVPA
ncbi:MAG: LysM peptidoglycan-binding domain-containing protein [Acidimicrobiales bacterium]|nr:LysM peptidoglycan-binding domain-containing protein [Acidimicrobiales bacterium]